MGNAAGIFVTAARRRNSQPNPSYIAALTGGDALLTRNGITTPRRMAHFLAQILHETGGGTVLFEDMFYRTADRMLQIFGVGNHSAAVRRDEVAGLLCNPPGLAERVYGLGNPSKARELGNTQPGDGYRYRGGGLLQTTGREAYRRRGILAGVDFEGNPELIVSADHALKPAIFEWAEGSLNAAADRNDLITITRVINGGLNGLDERQAWLALTAMLAGDGTGAPAWEAGTPDETTSWLQTALNRLGATPPLAVDGSYGPVTEAAVRQFQTSAGLVVDGVAGAQTRSAITARLAALA